MTIPGTEPFYKKLGFKNGNLSSTDLGEVKITSSKYSMYKKIKKLNFFTDLFKKLR